MGRPVEFVGGALCATTGATQTRSADANTKRCFLSMVEPSRTEPHSGKSLREYRSGAGALPADSGTVLPLSLSLRRQRAVEVRRSRTRRVRWGLNFRRIPYSVRMDITQSRVATVEHQRVICTGRADHFAEIDFDFSNPAKNRSGCYNFYLSFPLSPHRGRVAQLAEQLTLNQ
jgi:hypothetical protein